MKRFSTDINPFWKKVRNISVAVAAGSAALLAAPVALPAAVLTALGYVAAISGSIAIAAQATEKGE